MTTKKNVIEIFGDDGKVKGYRPFSERLPEFLKTFPVSEGFRVVIEAQDALAVRPGIAALYREAIQNGRTLTEAGLPNVSEGMVFTASLYDKTGNVVANASAMRFRLSEYKDWEKAETAARQRLLAALGFGGEILDEDEAGDMTEQGLRIKAPASVAPSKPHGKDKSKSDPAPVVDLAAAEGTPVEEKPEVGSPQTEVETSVTPEETIQPAILRQIEHQAKIKGKPVPKVKNMVEARSKLKELMSA